MNIQDKIIQQALRREELRKKGIDIEIQVVVDVIPKVLHTGKYRFIISYFDADRRLIKNYYSTDTYEGYLNTEEMAIMMAEK